MATVTTKRVGDLIREVEDGVLELRPYFQRRLVWTSSVKDRFLETVSLGLPFPEIFIATGKIDKTTMIRKNWLVDGQQRISTLRQYWLGSDDLDYALVKPYAELSGDENTAFLDYPVAVRDLGIITEREIKEIFARINSTDFALKAMERMNALFNGVYIKFCEKLAAHPILKKHGVFTTSDWRRMRDLDFCVILVTTLLSTYYHRSDLNAEYLARYNDEFPDGETMNGEIERILQFVDECSFGPKSRAWKKTDLLTLLVEIRAALVTKELSIQPNAVGMALSDFYSKVDELFANKNGGVVTPGADVYTYLKAATKATNDKYARFDRGTIIANLIAATIQKPTPSKRRKRDSD